jgi:HD superfamily phosphohydrolase
MHLTVYYHKTTVAFDTACRQLFRRMKDKPAVYGLPKDRTEVMALVQEPRFLEFDDSYVDLKIREAAKDTDPVISALADALLSRRAPKLLHEEVVLVSRAQADGHRGTLFKIRCEHHLAQLASDHGLELGHFLFSETKPLKFEQRSPEMTREEIGKLPPEDREELIRVYDHDKDKFTPLIEMPNTLLNHLAELHYKIYRLYVLCDDAARVGRMRAKVMEWLRSE